MLLTTCPNCAAQFKVQPEQLNVRQGRVMCGRCRQVFDAFQSLTRIEDGTSGQETLPAAVSEPHPPPALGTDDQIWPEGALTAATEVHSTSSELDVQPSRPLEPTEAVGDAMAPGPNEAQDEIPEAPAPQVDIESQPMAEPPAPASPGLVLDSDNPLLATPPPIYRPTPTGGLRWGLAGVVLGVLLLTQLTYAYRAQIAQQFPSMRPLLAAACGWAGCVIPRGRDESAIRIEASDLVEAPGRTGLIQLTATLVNRGAYSQEFPALELRLTDSGNQVVLSRIFLPPEYLGRIPAKEEALAAGAELFVNMQVELLAKPPASGYGVRAFYP